MGFAPASISLLAIKILPEIFSRMPWLRAVGVADTSLVLIPIPENWIFRRSTYPLMRHEAIIRPLTA
jgi:hypothetical protein